VNNAGINLRGWDAAGFEEIMRTNLDGALDLTLALLPHLAQGARVVMVASGAWAGGTGRSAGVRECVRDVWFPPRSMWAWLCGRASEHACVGGDVCMRTSARWKNAGALLRLGSGIGDAGAPLAAPHALDNPFPPAAAARLGLGKLGLLTPDYAEPIKASATLDELRAAAHKFIPDSPQPQHNKMSPQYSITKAAMIRRARCSRAAVGGML
jgi:NAD(P)-dependent dehydrogenase (short-subunit alcohol dehydrogenase family)